MRFVRPSPTFGGDGDVNVNVGSANTNGVFEPKAAMGPGGRMAVTWLERTTQGDLSTADGPILGIRLYNWNGTTASPTISPSFFRPNPTSKWFYSRFRQHDTAYRPDGVFLAFLEHYGEQSIVLTSRWTSEINIFALNADGSLADLNGTGNAGVMYELFLSDAFGAYRPNIAMLSSGEVFMVTQEEHTSSSLWRSSIYTFKSNLELYSSNAFYPYPTSFHGQAQFMNPDVASNSSRTLMAWQDGRDGNPMQVYAQFFDGANLSGTNFKVNAAGSGAVLPSVAVNASGSSVVAWLGNDATNGPQVWARAYGADGQPRSAQPIKVSDVPPGGDVYAKPIVALMDNGRYMVVWGDSSSVGFRARMRELDVDGGIYGGVKLVADADHATGQPHVTHDNTNFVLTWVDGRSSPGDAYMKVITPYVGTSIEPHPERSEGPALLGNYPNPFNPSTVVSYRLSVFGEVRISVVNQLGQYVATLFNGSQTPGQHFVTFDAAGLPSGMYIVVLESNGFRDMRKVMLVK